MEKFVCEIFVKYVTNFLVLHGAIILAAWEKFLNLWLQLSRAMSPPASRLELSGVGNFPLVGTGNLLRELKFFASSANALFIISCRGWNRRGFDEPRIRRYFEKTNFKSDVSEKLPPSRILSSSVYWCFRSHSSQQLLQSDAAITVDNIRIHIYILWVGLKTHWKFIENECLK